MGTNYYLTRIPTKEEIEKTKKLLNERKIKTTWDGWDKNPGNSVQDMVAIMTESIHIGKSSGGWRFAFRDNGLCERSYEAIYKYLEQQIASKLWKIENEYNEEIKLKDFIKLIDSKKQDYHLFNYPNIDYYWMRCRDKTDFISDDGSWWITVDFS